MDKGKGDDWEGGGAREGSDSGGFLIYERLEKTSGRQSIFN